MRGIHDAGPGCRPARQQPRYMPDRFAPLLVVPADTWEAKGTLLARGITATERATMRTLIGVDHGRWAVRTESTTIYEVDLDNSTLTRQPAVSSADPNPMRRDGDALRLLRIVSLTVGSPGIVLVDLALARVAFTTRITTNVVSITYIGPGVGNESLVTEFCDVVGGWEGPRGLPSARGDRPDAGLTADGATRAPTAPLWTKEISQRTKATSK